MVGKLKKYISKKIFKQDLISVFKIKIKDIDYLEIINDNIYYLKYNKLFVIYNYQQIDINFLENFSKNCGSSDLHYISMWKLNDKLFCSIKNNANFYDIISVFDNKVIYTYNYPILEEYIKISKTKSLFLFDTYDKNKSMVLYVKNNKPMVVIEDIKIFSIAYLKSYVYANIKEHQSSKIKIISKINFFGKINLISKEIATGLYYKIIEKNKKLLLCQDGPTKIF
ncbi:hypothetical protein CYC98_04505 [Campylobacter coli]|nr:hypothetical protein [Campylobacter coli]